MQILINFLISLVEAVEKFYGLLGLLLLGCSSLEPGPPGLEPLLPLPDPLVGGLTGLVTGLEAGDSSAEVLRDVREENMNLFVENSKELREMCRFLIPNSDIFLQRYFQLQSPLQG